MLRARSILPAVGVAAGAFFLLGAGEADAQEVPTPPSLDQVVEDAAGHVETQIDAFIDDALAPYGSAEEGGHYHKTNGPIEQFVAGTQGEVLHRVPGSMFDAPDVPQEALTAEEQGTALYGPGTPIYVGDQFCTLTMAGHDDAGRSVGLTAGHCGGEGAGVSSADAPGLGQTGAVSYTNPELDYSVIEFDQNAEVTNTYNGITADEVGGEIADGQQVCKMGVASGFTCGHSWDSTPAVNYNQVCARVGDSGAPLLIGNRVVGMVNGGLWDTPQLQCHSPLQGPAHMPTVSVRTDAILNDMNQRGGVGAGFTPA